MSAWPYHPPAGFADVLYALTQAALDEGRASPWEDMRWLDEERAYRRRT